MIRRAEETPGRVRVLFVHTATAPPLGADTWIHAQIMSNLDPEIHEVHAACATGPPGRPTPTYEEIRKIDGVRIRPVNFGTEQRSPSRFGRIRTALGTFSSAPDLIGLARYIRRNHIDIIHTSDRPRDAAASVLLGRMTGAVSVVHAHTGYADWMSPLLKRALRHADVRIGVSSFVAGTLRDSGHRAERTYVVLNGIDPSSWTPRTGGRQVRQELGLGETPVILTACRLFPSKGPADLIRALSAVRDRYPNVQLLIAGGELVTGFRSDLINLARTLAVDGNVKFLGYRHDVDHLMAAADVFAMPSVGEPFGLVYAEAMAMELPVVALHSGGAPEIIEHGVTGLLSRAGDIPALSENLSSLLSQPDRRLKMGTKGRHRVETSFTSKRMATDVAAVYQQILSNASPSTYEGSNGGIAIRS
jgi:glycosyltransferase involved in cell wall biosynthesis